MRLENMPPRMAFITTRLSRSLVENATPGRTTWICDCAPGLSTSTMRLSAAALDGAFGPLCETAGPALFHVPNVASSLGRSVSLATSPATTMAAFLGTNSRPYALTSSARVSFFASISSPARLWP